MISEKFLKFTDEDNDNVWVILPARKICSLVEHRKDPEDDESYNYVSIIGEDENWTTRMTIDELYNQLIG